MFMVIVVGKEGLHSFQYPGFIEFLDRGIMLFREHSFFSIGVCPLIADELLKFSCARLPTIDGTLPSGDLPVSPHICQNPHVSYSLKGPVNNGVNRELLV